MSTTFTQDIEAERFVLRDEDGALLSAVDYSINRQSVIALTHVFTPPALRGHGYAGQAVEQAVTLISHQGGLRIRPTCWYAARWFERHPEWNSILAD